MAQQQENINIFYPKPKVPATTKLLELSKPLWFPAVKIAEQSLIPLGYNILETVDEKVITRLADKTNQMIDKTRQTMVIIRQTSDQIATQCYSKVVPKFDANEEKVIMIILNCILFIRNVCRNMHKTQFWTKLLDTWLAS